MKPLLMLFTVIMSAVAARSTGSSALPASGVKTTPYADSTNPRLRNGEGRELMFLCSNNALVSMQQWFKEGRVAQGVAGYTKQGRPLDVFFFPGATDKRALVIGGMHGSELSSVEVAKALLRQLQEGEALHYSVIIIPCLFPDNAALALSNPLEIGGVTNTGRYTSNTAADPNRQMPALGKPYDPKQPVDFMGRQIEKENQLLLSVINEFRPSRIVNIHAIRNVNQSGVYADPRTDHNGFAAGFETDSSLALRMASYIVSNGGRAEGNRLDSLPTARYQNDPCPAPYGFLQKRNLQGSLLPNKRGHGVSLGGWATTAIVDNTNPSNNRDAMRLITMEFPGYCRPADYQDELQRVKCSRLIDLYAESIKHVFLGNNYVEGEENPANRLATTTGYQAPK